MAKSIASTSGASTAIKTLKAAAAAAKKAASKKESSTGNIETNTSSASSVQYRKPTTVKATSAKRGNRLKNILTPNADASQRGTLAIERLGKNLLRQKYITEKIMPRAEQFDKEYKAIVFIDNYTKKPIIALSRKNERTKLIAYIQQLFIRESQNLRDQISLEALGSFLTELEEKAIKLKNNAYIFPELITSKGNLRSKDNKEVLTTGAIRIRGKFTKKDSPATVTPRSQLIWQRVQALKAKALAYYNQLTNVGQRAPRDKGSMATLSYWESGVLRALAASRLR